MERKVSARWTVTVRSLPDFPTEPASVSASARHVQPPGTMLRPATAAPPGEPGPLGWGAPRTGQDPWPQPRRGAGKKSGPIPARPFALWCRMDGPDGHFLFLLSLRELQLLNSTSHPCWPEPPEGRSTATPPSPFLIFSPTTCDRWGSRGSRSSSRERVGHCGCLQSEE